MRYAVWLLALAASCGRPADPETTAGARPLVATEQVKLVASDGAVNDYFGTAVAVSGDTAVVGAPWHSAKAGGAYVFVRTGSTWSPQTTLVASDGAAEDQLGSAVAVDGDTAVITAPVQTGTAGAAYVFVRSSGTWTEQAKLVASDGVAGDQLGAAVALAGDTAVVTTRLKASYSGAAYVFVRSGTTWTQQGKLVASDGAANDYLGQSVAVGGDTAVVGTVNPGSFRGAAYVFVRSGVAWTEQAKLLASDGVGFDFFGQSVAVIGDTTLVGAQGTSSYTGAVYVFNRSSGSWTEHAKLTAGDGVAGDDFGVTLAASGDMAVIGASNVNAHTGAAYVFVRSSGTWTEQVKLRASDGAADDRFGGAVSLSGDTTVVGTQWKNQGKGAAYVYTLRKSNGEACTTAAECASGYCADGTCCVEACTAPCKSCANANGTCTTMIAAGETDPNATPACVAPYACDGLGACKKTNGETCATGGDCLSTECADGVCCNEACDLPCHYCALSTSKGTCTLQPDGEDHRTECQASSGGSDDCAGKCRSGQCAYPDVGTTCGVCSVCDGTGRCTATPADDDSCGTITCSGLDTACRSYQDVTSGRCASLGSCKQPNAPATCTAYVDLPCEDGGAAQQDAGAPQPGQDAGTGGGSSGGCQAARGTLAGAWPFALAALALALARAPRRRPAVTPPRRARPR
jgi:hypothetical protein